MYGLAFDDVSIRKRQLETPAVACHDLVFAKSVEEVWHRDNQHGEFMIPPKWRQITLEYSLTLRLGARVRAEWSSSSMRTSPLELARTSGHYAQVIVSEWVFAHQQARGKSPVPLLQERKAWESLASACTTRDQYFTESSQSKPFARG